MKTLWLVVYPVNKMIQKCEALLDKKKTKKKQKQKQKKQYG